MNDRELTYVKAIADEGSISAAARKLFIAQPSLSQSLAHIEESLGTRLFDRTPNGLRPTEAGQKYLLMANRVLKLYNDLLSELTDLEELSAGTVTFGITRLLGKIILPEVLPEFHRCYPNIKIRIHEGNSKQLDRALTACEISFAVMHRISADSNNHIAYDVFWKDPFVVTVAADSPLVQRATADSRYPFPLIDIAELANEPLLTVPYGHRIRQVVDSAFMRAGVRATVTLETKDYTTVQTLAAEGMGYTIGPQSYTKLTAFDRSRVRFLSLDESLDASWSLCLAKFKNGSLSRADLALKTHFEDVISDMMDESERQSEQGQHG